MWFVWDGQRRHGPLSENEICRRLATGECSLRSWVRNADDSFYRPMTWMLKSWAFPEPTPIKIHQDVLLEATQIASPLLHAQLAQPTRNDDLNSPPDLPTEQQISVEFRDQSAVQQSSTSSFKPEFPENLQELSRGKHLEFSLKDSLKSILSGKLSELKLFSHSKNELPAESSLENESSDAQDEHSVGDVSQDLAEQQSHEGKLSGAVRSGTKNRSGVGSSGIPVFEVDKSGLPVVEAEPAEALQVAVANNVIGRNQLPKIASEGVVSLAGKVQQPRPKARRVNPTAPRHPKRKKTFWENFVRSASNTFLDPTLLKVFLVSIALSLAGLIAFSFYRKQNSTIPVLTVEADPVVKQDPTIKKIRESVAQRAARQEKRVPIKRKQTNAKTKAKVNSKSMRARSASPSGASSSKVKKVSRQFKNDALASQSALSAHLASSKQGGFIVVGPLQLLQPPPAQCSPCEGRVRMPDGTTLIVRSVMAQQWKELRFQRSFYARGSLVKAKPYFLFLNKVSASPDFK